MVSVSAVLAPRGCLPCCQNEKAKRSNEIKMRIRALKGKLCFAIKIRKAGLNSYYLGRYLAPPKKCRKAILENLKLKGTKIKFKTVAHKI